MVLNRFMSSFGPTPVAVCAIGSQLESISWNTTEGIQVGIQALVAQNYGAEDKKRVEGSIKESFRLVAIIGIVATVFLIAFRHKLFELFTQIARKQLNLVRIIYLFWVCPKPLCQ